MAANGVRMKFGDWVVVCDGRKALILENEGDDKFPNLRRYEVFELDNPATHDQGTSAPGRVHASAGTARSAVEQTDWHDQAERDFLRSVVTHLDSKLEQQERSLIIAAPPRALGILRSLYTRAVQTAIRREIDKDYVKMPIHQIEREIEALRHST